MTDLSKLSDDQLKNASYVIEAANVQGIDPNYALAVAFSESRLDNSRKSDKGAIGLMQLMPETAKALKVNPADPRENADGGVRYLKQQLDAFGGNKYLASIAYNAGPGVAQQYAKTNDMSVIPDESLQYVNRINGIYQLQPKPEEGGGQSVADITTPPPPEQKEYGFSPEQDILAGGIGAVTGAGAGLTKSIGSNVAGMSRAIQDMPAAIREATLKQSFPVPTDPQHTRQMQGTTEQGATGRARMTTFNEQTAQQAAARAQQEKVLADLAKKGVISPENVLAKTAGVTSTPSGVLLPSGVVYEPTAPAPAPKMTPLQQAGQGVRAIGRGVSNVLNIPGVRGALGGAGVGAGAAETVERIRSDDVPGAVVSGVGTLGSLASMYPPLAPIGTATALGATGALGLMDRVRNQPQQPFVEPTPAELEEASKPAFGVYPKQRMRPRQPNPNAINGALLQSLDQQMQEFQSQPG